MWYIRKNNKHHAKTMEYRRRELRAREQTLVEVIFLGDSLPPILFIIAMTFLKSQEKINCFTYVYAMEIFAKIIKN